MLSCLWNSKENRTNLKKRKSKMKLPNSEEYPFDVAISFAGEDRDTASQLYDLLIAKGIKVFYDMNDNTFAIMG
jgi:hypothetical protein